jgi:outer membrane cobalamin receptor
MRDSKLAVPQFAASPPSRDSHANEYVMLARVSISVLLVAIWSPVATGQVQSTRERGADSVRATQLDTIVVTPERSATTIHASTVALTILTGSLLRQLPVRSVAAALVLSPGVAVVDANSVGGNPRLIVRGFYGGGETDYLAALLDGVPVAALGSGAVDWDMLPRTAIRRLELVRGGASYMRGDAALAGALNLVADNRMPFTWRTAGGTYNSRDVTMSGGYERGTDRFGLDLDYHALGGFRVHEQRTASTVTARFAHHGDTRAITAFASTHARDFEDPGPLPSTTEDDRSSNPFFRGSGPTPVDH